MRPKTANLIQILVVSSLSSFHVPVTSIQEVKIISAVAHDTNNIEKVDIVCNAILNAVATVDQLNTATLASKTGRAEDFINQISVSLPVVESIIYPATSIPSGIRGCWATISTESFTAFSVSWKPVSHF